MAIHPRFDGRVRSLRRIGPILLASLALVLAGTPPVGALAPEVVLATSAYEWKAAASDQYLAWTAWNGRRNIAYARELGGSRFRVNRRGSEGVVGAIDGTTLIYQEYTFTGRARSDIWFLDLETRTRTRAPERISSRRWEYAPSLSGDWVLFARWFRTGDRRLYLYNLTTDELRVIASTSGARRSLWAGQVNGQHVAYEKWAWNGRGRTTACDVYRYDIESETTTRVPNPGPRCQWGPSVNAAGTVYHGRSGFACGRNVALRKFAIAGQTELVWRLPRNRDLELTYALDKGDGATDVFYTTYRCGRVANIHKIEEPAPETGVSLQATDVEVKTARRFAAGDAGHRVPRSQASGVSRSTGPLEGS